MTHVQANRPITQLHIGCGPCPIRGWHNYDSNLFVHIAKLPFATHLVACLPFVPRSIIAFMALVNKYDINFADAAKRLPEPHDSVHTMYSSHMLEHLERDEAVAFLKEAQRVLLKGGIIRIVVPNLDYFVRTYLEDNDSHKFIEDLCLVSAKPKKLIKKLQYVIMGHGWHHAMYNEQSLVRLVEEAGFVNITILRPGETMIANHDGLNLREHEEQSIYLEAYKP